MDCRVDDSFLWKKNKGLIYGLSEGEGVKEGVRGVVGQWVES